MVDNIENEKGDFALDIGSGSGYLTKLLSENFSFVVGTDINYEVLKHQTYKTKNLICCNGSDALKIKFDLIVCNLPYLATDEILDIATDGGHEGFEIPKQIIDSAYNNIKKNTMNKDQIQIINKIFSYRRKTIKNILKQFNKETVIDKRLDDLSGDEIIHLANQILKK